MNTLVRLAYDSQYQRDVIKFVLKANKDILETFEGENFCGSVGSEPFAEQMFVKC